ncbi:MAG: response regulator [Anaerolineales bacterium]|nr:response regulator [Anaerolineales bacterium]
MNLMQKILVVDDEVELVQLYRLVLESVGYDVHGAYDGKQALRIANEEQPNLVLLDVMMPGMDGIEVCRHMRQSGLDKQTCKIIMYTADDSSETRQDSMSAGADELVSKTTPIYDLASKIQNYLANYQ